MIDNNKINTKHIRNYFNAWRILNKISKKDFNNMISQLLAKELKSKSIK